MTLYTRNNMYVGVLTIVLRLLSYLRLCVWHEYDTLVSQSVAHVGKTNASVSSSALHHCPTGGDKTCTGGQDDEMNQQFCTR